MSAFAQLGIVPDSMEPVPLNFGEWLPDIQTLNNPGSTQALNVIPNEMGYVPFKDIVPLAGLALPAECKGAIMLKDRKTNARLYAATKDKLFVRTGAAFTELWTAGIGHNPAPIWIFVQFGTYLVALHPEERPLSSSTDGSDPFLPIGGSPPKAACGARVGDFLVLGNLEGEDDPVDSRWPSRIRWGGFNRIDADWTSDPLTQADFQDMPAEGGEVMAIAGREVGTIFQERLISRMTYVGLPAVFEIETVEEDRGAICTGGVIDIGTQIFYIADDGFYMWNGTNSTPIGSNRINRYFFERVNYAERKRIVGAVDYENQCVRWMIPVGDGTALEETLIYSYKDQRWSHAYTNYEFLVPSYVLPASLDDLLEDLDEDYPISFDDNSFLTQRQRLGGFNAEHTFGTFNGAALAAILETGDANSPGGRRVMISNVRPVVDSSLNDMTVQIAARDQVQGAALVWGAAVAQEITGDCPALAEGRYVRVRLNIPAGSDWQHAQGVEIWRKALGRR